MRETELSQTHAVIENSFNHSSPIENRPVLGTNSESHDSGTGPSQPVSFPPARFPPVSIPILSLTLQTSHKQVGAKMLKTKIFPSKNQQYTIHTVIQY